MKPDYQHILKCRNNKAVLREAAEHWTDTALHLFHDYLRLEAQPTSRTKKLEKGVRRIIWRRELAHDVRTIARKAKRRVQRFWAELVDDSMLDAER